MPHTLRYDQDVDCIFLTVDDEVTIDLVKAVAPQVASLCRATGCYRILNDMRAATIKLSFMEIFGSPAIMDYSKMPQGTKRALVVNPHFTDANFLEDVSQNRGHNLKVFTDIQEARQWLLAKA